MPFWKALYKMDFRFEFGVKNYVFQHRSKLVFDIFGKLSKLEVKVIKNSLKSSFSAVGSIKKRFLMVESCLEHISKRILIGKSLVNYLNN